MHTASNFSSGTHVQAAPELSARVWVISAVAALGGLLFGYDWVVIGGARQFYETYFHLSSSAQIGWANSCALLGCLLGSLLSGRAAERWGRKPLLLCSAVLFAVSSALTGFAMSFAMFVTWRILGGIAIGMSSNVSPLYIAEISPANIRGKLVSLNQFAIVVGILLAQIVNWGIARPIPVGLAGVALEHSWNVQRGWRWMFLVIVVPSAVFAIASAFLPETPRWLMARGRRSSAHDVLQKIGGKIYAEQAIAEIEASMHNESPAAATWRDLFRPKARNILVVTVALAVLQQWCGINILFNYAAEIYHNAGYGANDIFLNIVITGSVNLLFTLLAMVLVETAGRRKLMLSGCAGIAVSHLLCALAYRQGWPPAVVLSLTLSAIGFYAATLAPVTWVLIAELFPNRLRANGMSAAVSALWVASFVLTYSFPAMQRALGTGTLFAFYGLVCVAGGLLVYARVPETKQRTLEEISASY